VTRQVTQWDAALLITLTNRIRSGPFEGISFGGPMKQKREP